MVYIGNNSNNNLVIADKYHPPATPPGTYRRIGLKTCLVQVYTSYIDHGQKVPLIPHVISEQLHVLVCFAHNGPPNIPEAQDVTVDHIYKNRTNNHVNNLRWAGRRLQRYNQMQMNLEPDYLRYGLCSVPGCNNKIVHDGKCKKHGPSCSFPKCDSAIHKDGKCKKHGPSCSFPGCDEQVVSDGKCRNHI